MTNDTDEPLTRLDETLDVLSVAIARVPDLPGLIDGLEGYELLLRFVSVHQPGAVDAVAVAPVWHALAAVATEVLTLRNIKENT
ncbi:hypothetical protein [Nocardioides sp.]|uniref:hypothetical protein n=1 Tax=Nocardioides sp. TaxID=35761 RepID=UPI0026082D0E|nr:hypothetical protein [Nocardioides sp.]MCW2738862.1 hypothetical protein [Nocardioides sp.]